jgi:hypothetical protein
MSSGSSSNMNSDDVFTVEVNGSDVTLAVLDGGQKEFLIRSHVAHPYEWTEDGGLVDGCPEDVICLEGSVSPETVCKLADIRDVSGHGLELMKHSLKTNGYIMAQRLSLVLLEGEHREDALADRENFVELKQRCGGNIPGKVPLFGLVDGAHRYDAIRHMQSLVVEECDVPPVFAPSKYFLVPVAIYRKSDMLAVTVEATRCNEGSSVVVTESVADNLRRLERVISLIVAKVQR